MFEGIINFFKKFSKNEEESKSKDTAKERLHLVLMQDRANVSADFLELMKQEIIEVIKKYIEIDEKAIDVRLTNKANDDGTTGAPALYANIPIMNIKHEMNKKPEEEKKEEKPEEAKEQEEKKEEKQEEKKEEVDSGVAHPEEDKKEEKQEESKEEKEEPKGEQKEEKETAEISKD